VIWCAQSDHFRPFLDRT